MNEEKQIEEMQIEEMAKDLRALDCLQYNPNYTVSYQRAVGLHSLGYRKASDVAREIFEEIDDLKCYIRLNEDIALKCKRENGEQNEEYFNGKLAAFKQIRGFIDVELKRQHKEQI